MRPGMLDNLLAPPILFFLLGMAATWLRSDLEVPKPVARFLSLYLLFSIGLHGGVELSRTGLTGRAWATLGVAVLFAVVTPLASFVVLRLKLGVADAAAVAATYGSISAVTFVTAGSFLADRGVPAGGHMVAAMALMESPAIVVGVVLARLLDPESRGGAERVPAAEVAREAFLNGAVFLLLGSLVIGAVAGERGWEAVRPVADAPFKGVLCLFLLDMGLAAARRLRDLRGAGAFLAGFAVLAPVIQSLLGLATARALGLGLGDALLLAVLTGSASYIAVPAAMRLSIPRANPSLYVPMALAVTFPFNVVIGIPLYFHIAGLLGISSP